MVHELINSVVALRTTNAEINEVVKAKYAEFERANAELLDSKRVVAERLSEAEAELRAAILALYKITGDKKPAQGCGVRVGLRLVYDAAKALEWAKEHGLALSLDKKSFEAIAATQQLEFVSNETSLTATIATELAAIETA